MGGLALVPAARLSIFDHPVERAPLVIFAVVTTVLLALARG